MRILEYAKGVKELATLAAKRHLCLINRNMPYYQGNTVKRDVYKYMLE